MEVENKRVGNFTSSEIWELTTEGTAKGSMGKRCLSYIDEKNYERRLGRRINSDAFSYPTSWGKIVEKYVFAEYKLVPYVLCSDEVLVHNRIPYWKGTPDLLSMDIVGDIKCPFTMTSFCSLIHSIEEGDLKKDHKEYYWQLVSNAIITGLDMCELIVFCPIKSELPKIREFADAYDGPDPFQYKWIVDSRDEKFPFLLDNGGYESLNRFTWEVEDSEKDFLTEKVKLAGAKLNNFNF